MDKRRETLDTTTPASIEMVVTKMPNSTTIVNLIKIKICALPPLFDSNMSALIKLVVI